MKTATALFFTLLLCASLHGGPQWESRARSQSATKGYITISTTGSEDFGAVLRAHLSKGISLEHIYLARSWTEDRRLQEQLLTTLQVITPRETDEALRSAGNMHNPKVIALHSAVATAFLRTDLVHSLNSELHKHGLEINRVSLEKLTLRRDGNAPTIDACVWLVVTQMLATPPPAP